VYIKVGKLRVIFAITENALLFQGLSTGEMRETMRRELHIILYRVIMARTSYHRHSARTREYALDYPFAFLIVRL